ncbi:Multidrug export protein EmrA [Methylacidimicrobium cyclopophantes]|uniref:Multidrug export protein EmrA n=1 Tax=Methylacidimicrobium cyclopophantes TaxID=1041766 RepID=A0A5E6M6G7_9BACT|nr:HlyD family secretion protein [Methylacidimicrobium cyclopophantes]VVM04529.1 Multidrug export protein EmrA [Methylacidimicrobium cyclopophantes]
MGRVDMALARNEIESPSAAKTGSASDQGREQNRPRLLGGRARLVSSILLSALIGGVVAVASLRFLISFFSNETTDDAFIAGHIIRVSPKVAGHVVGYHIDDNMDVKKGQLLIEIDPRDYQARVALAQANRDWADTEWKRMAQLVRSASVSQLQLDGAWAAKLSTEAYLRLTQLQLGYTQVFAPEDGRITQRTVERGQYVQVGETLFSIVPSHVWVVANYKETQLTNMRPGQPVLFRIDAYPDHLYKGHVDSLQRGSGAQFSLLPPENATGNYVKVVQRVPVKILFDQPIRAGETVGPGMSVVPSVRVREIAVSPIWEAVAFAGGAFAGILLVFLLSRRQKNGVKGA